MILITSHIPPYFLQTLDTWAPSKDKDRFFQVWDSHTTVARLSYLYQGIPILVRRYLYTATTPRFWNQSTHFTASISTYCMLLNNVCIGEHFVVLCVGIVICLFLVDLRVSFAHIFRVSRAGTSNYIPHLLWNVVTYPCPLYLLFAQHFPNQPVPTHNKAMQKQTLCMSYWYNRHVNVYSGSGQELRIYMHQNTCWLIGKHDHKSLDLTHIPCFWMFWGSNS